MRPDPNNRDNTVFESTGRSVYTNGFGGIGHVPSISKTDHALNRYCVGYGADGGVDLNRLETMALAEWVIAEWTRVLEELKMQTPEPEPVPVPVEASTDSLDIESLLQELQKGHDPQGRDSELIYCVGVEGGKYTFTMRKTGDCQILRHGAPWVEVKKASKALIAAFGELERNRIILMHVLGIMQKAGIKSLKVES